MEATNPTGLTIDTRVIEQYQLNEANTPETFVFGNQLRWWEPLDGEAVLQARWVGLRTGTERWETIPYVRETQAQYKARQGK